MCGNAFFFQLLKYIISHPVVYYAFSYDGSLLLTVESGGIILVIYDHNTFHIRCKYFLSLAFVQLF